MKNKTRKRRLLPVLFALGIFALIGGTIAVSQDRSILDSLFHLKHGETSTTDWVPPAGWKRCDETPKEVSTTNNSTFPIRVRLSYDEYWLAADGTSYLPVAPGGNRLTTINLQNQNDWEDGNDGWMYWKGTLAPGASTRSLLKSVTYNCDTDTPVETICTKTAAGTVCDQPKDPYEDASYHVFVTVQTTEENGQFPEDTLYNVSIDPNGGTYNGSSEIYTDRVRSGTVIDLSSIERQDFEFRDWTLNGTDTFTDSSIRITEDTTLSANWLSNIFHTVSVNPNGGTYDGSTATSTYSVREGDNYTILDVARENYALEKWEYADGTPVDGNVIPNITDDVSIKAIWAPAIARIERTGKLYSSIMRAEAEAETNDTITLLADTAETVTNEKTITLDLDEHTITGSITNASTGNLTLINGEINNPNGAAVTNNGTLTMGINDYKADGSANILNDNIRLVGTEVGLQQNSVFNFYDGFIEGDVALAGGYDSAPYYHNVEHDTDIYYYPFISHNDVKDCQHAELASADNSVTKTTVGGDIYYLNLQDNIDASTVTGYKIYAVRNFSATYPVTVNANTAIEFDVAGYEVNFADTLTNNGDLTITNSGTAGKAITSQTIVNNGELIVRNAEISGSTINDTITNNRTIRLRSGTLSATNGYVLRTVANTKLDMDDDSYITTTSTERGAIYNQADDFLIDGGHIVAPYIGIEGAANSSFSMSGGEISVKRNDRGDTFGIHCATPQGCSIYLYGDASINVGSNTADGQAYDSYGVYNYHDSGSFTMEDDASITSSLSTGRDSCIYNFANVTLRENATLTADSRGYGNAISSGSSSLVIEDNSNVQILAKGSTATGINYANAVMNSGTVSAVSNYPWTGQGATGIDYGGGSLVMNGGTISATDTNTGVAYGLTGGSSSYGRPSTLTINDGTVVATSKTGESRGVTGGTGGNFMMKGGNISATSTEGTSTGAYFSNNENYITGGVISGGTYGINTNNNTVTIGSDDGGEPSITTPEIVSENYGTYNGSYNFYDGIIKGGQESYKDGTISSVPDATIVHTEIIDGKKASWLASADNYLEVDGVQYNSLTKAYNAITGDSGTIKVIADTRVEAALPTSPADKTITFDLNGHNLVYTQTMTVGGVMNIVDNSANHDGSLSNPNTYTITNNGTLNIQSGTINAANRAIMNNQDHVINISGGTVSAAEIGIENWHNNTVTMTGGLIDVSSENGRRMYGIYCSYSCNTILEGNSAINVGRKTDTGTTDWVYGIYENYYTGTIVMKDNSSINVNATNTGVGIDGVVFTLRDDAALNIHSTNSAYGAYSEGASSIEANSNVLINVTSDNSSCQGIYILSDSILTMNSGTIAVSGTGGQWGSMSAISGDGTFILVDGSISATNPATNSTTYGINNVSTEIRGGDVTVNSYYTCYGYNSGSSSSFTMSNGDISATCSNGDGYGAFFKTNNNTITGGKISGSSYGISTASNNAVTLGVDDDTAPSITSPEIVGEIQGTNTGSYYFYDGIIKGGQRAYSQGTITAIPDATIYHTEVIDGKENCWLISADNYLEVDGVQYNSLKKAYDAITGSTGIVKVIASTQVEATLPASPADKEIDFDLNGHELIYTQTMTVGDGGTLNIVDSSQAGDGVLKNPNTYVITNNGTLNIKTGTISSPNKAIKNGDSKTINITGGEIKAVNTGIEEGNYGTVTMTGGIINVASDERTTIYGIYCYYSCSTTMSGNSTIHVGHITASGNVDTSYAFYNSYYYSESFVMEDNATIDVFSANNARGISSSRNVTLRDNASITINSNNNSQGIYNANIALTIEANSNVRIAATAPYSSTGISSSKITMYSGTITATSTANNSYWGATGVSIQDGSLALIDGAIYASNSGGIGHAYGIDGGSMYTGTTDIRGGTIRATNDLGDSYGIHGQSADRHSISGGTITAISTDGGTGTGILFDSAYQQYNLVTGGQIYGSTYGINGNNRAVIIGDNEGGTPSAVKPEIVGGSYGIYNGEFKFYDGILKGIINSYNAADDFAELATDSALAFGTEIISGDTYQTCYLVPEYDVAQIGSTKYTKLSDAIAAANVGDTIELIATNYLFADLTIAANKDLTIDMNGYNIVSGHPITNNGKVRLTNSSTTSHPVLSYRKSGYYFTNTGTLELGQVQLEAPYIINNSGNLALVESQLTSSNTAISNSGTTTFSDTVISADNIGITSTGTISNSMSDSSRISGTNYGIYNNGGSVTIDSAQLSGGTAYYQLNDNAVSALSSVNITGFVTSQAGTSSITDSVVTKSGERVVGNVIGNTGSGSMTITNVDIYYSTVGIESYYDTPAVMIYNNGTATVTSVNMNMDISGGIYRGDSYGIKNDGSRLDATDINIVYNNHDITSDNYSAAYGLRNGSGTLNFYSGSVEVTNRATTYGIYNGDGETTIGVEDDSPAHGTPDADVSTTDPRIYAIGTTTGYGVKNESGRVDFYDGRITGSTHPMPDMPTIPTKAEYHFEVRSYTDIDGYQYIILQYIQS